MILVVTNSYDPTADFVLQKFEEWGVATFRLNTDKAFSFDHLYTLSDNQIPRLTIKTKDGTVDSSNIVGVWYRRPVLPKVENENFSPQAKYFAEEEMYYFFKCFYRLVDGVNWVSHPWAISWANVKLDQLSIARDLGFVIPDTIATNMPSELKQFFYSHPNGVVVKPFKANTLEYGPTQMASIYTSIVTQDDMNGIESARHTITCFQEKIDKLLEVRVSIFGDQVFVAAIDSQSNKDLRLDWRRTSENATSWFPYNVPNEIAHRCLQLVKHYDLKFGAIDLALTPSGEYIFFELNPNGQWAWLEIDLGIPMSRALCNVLLGCD